ncbi:15906_t:CDS:2 [Gigaspora margarita]|uniref:15906_t:CDS:1 n=1 Tax=Gigaspora margarita TaxID=4874 RepID=A0ABN7VWD5_GIGMA|nr:15906_t:CDS:2 [Gigaspora margarita]
MCYKSLELVTKDLKIEMMPQYSSVIRVKVIDTVYLSLNVPSDEDDEKDVGM